MHRWLVVSLLVACGTPAAPRAPEVWPVPTGWKSETIPFPLGFAPTLAHQGVEELRFPPGFTAPDSPHRWSYVFEWRLTDAAQLDAAGMGAELTTYFRGLLAAVDGERKRFSADEVTAIATPLGDDGFALAATIFDAFSDAARIELVGHATRSTCGVQTVWRFVLAPAGSPLRSTLDELAGRALCP